MSTPCHTPMNKSICITALFCQVKIRVILMPINATTFAAALYTICLVLKRKRKGAFHVSSDVRLFVSISF